MSLFSQTICLLMFPSSTRNSLQSSHFNLWMNKISVNYLLLIEHWLSLVKRTIFREVILGNFSTNVSLPNDFYAFSISFNTDVSRSLIWHCRSESISSQWEETTIYNVFISVANERWTLTKCEKEQVQTPLAQKCTDSFNLKFQGAFAHQKKYISLRIF